MSFNKQQVEPGDAIDLQIATDPASLVNVLAVDQSVLILGTGNDVTQSGVCSFYLLFLKSTFAFSFFEKNVEVRSLPLRRHLCRPCDCHRAKFWDIWRGHQTSPTVVSLKGRLPQKLQSKSNLSREIVQIQSLFRHGFYKETEIKI